MNTFPQVTPFENVVYLPRFQTKNGKNTINPKQISFLVAQGNYTLFHLKTGELVLTSLPLGSYVSMLEWYGFVRIHKSYLVNLDCLLECTIQSFSIVTFPNGEVVEIARRRRNKLRKLFEIHQIIFNP
ncbi:LytR/AlgR family response regulator transcription factor [Runella aurantiaca]|uniref:LytTR family transcriptional regulator n=1 Tax=Runella aurantiaca TaxID=2282308 RepID=A0A369I1S2_9BACT|nr:LytTR family DNA-binding domain-containing protein [Runella aurantiaca]RDB02427.1 LytTR family transcriptional regulator [Runella aurantiaca]